MHKDRSILLLSHRLSAVTVNPWIISQKNLQKNCTNIGLATLFIQTFYFEIIYNKIQLLWEFFLYISDTFVGINFEIFVPKFYEHLLSHKRIKFRLHGPSLERYKNKMHKWLSFSFVISLKHGKTGPSSKGEKFSKD